MSSTAPGLIQRIPFADIEISNGGRDLQDDKVSDLAASMRRIGMLNSIGVRVVDGAPRLVYGRHRIAAAQLVDWADVECHLLDADDRRARMAEIAENLHRTDLTPRESSDQITEWLKLAEDDDRDKPAQVAQVSPAAGRRGNKGGLSEAARETPACGSLIAAIVQGVVGRSREAKGRFRPPHVGDGSGPLEGLSRQHGRENHPAANRSGRITSRSPGRRSQKREGALQRCGGHCGGGLMTAARHVSTPAITVSVTFRIKVAAELGLTGSIFLPSGDALVKGDA
jgi:hypothetical protein